MDRAHFGKRTQQLDEALAFEALSDGRDELDEHLPRVAPFADYEMAQIAGLVLLRIGVEPLLASPRLHDTANRVAEIGREPALVDLEHFVPAARLVEAQCGP